MLQGQCHRINRGTVCTSYGRRENSHGMRERERERDLHVPAISSRLRAMHERAGQVVLSGDLASLG